MADGMEAFLRVRRYEFDLRILFQLVAQVLVFTIYNSQQGLFAQFLVQALGDFQIGGACGIFPYAAIFQRYFAVSHCLFLLKL